MKYCFRSPLQTALPGVPRILLFGVLLVGFIAPCSRAQSFSEAKLTPADLQDGEEFGEAIALDGDVAVIGARRDSDDLFGVGDYGAAYVFRYDGSQWVEEIKLTSPQRDFYQYFGTTVAVHGDLVLVGTTNDSDIPLNAGAVYVYRYDGSRWAQETRLTASDLAQGANFGSSLAVADDVILIGSSHRNGAVAQEGAVYVYGHDGSQWVRRRS